MVIWISDGYSLEMKYYRIIWKIQLSKDRILEMKLDNESVDRILWIGQWVGYKL
jgi:hypothetical protein